MYNNKKVIILGFAKSGYEVAKILIKRNNEVIINDSKTIDKIDKEKYEELLSLGVSFVLGDHPDDLLDNTIDYLIKNPGVPIDHKYVLKAKALNIDVINEVEVAYNLLKEKNIKYIAITGTNGKTTTTTLIYEMLKKDNFPVHLAGNIGYPLSSFVDKVNENDIIVIEVSCQQLENLQSFNPNIAVITNVTQAHLEFMKTLKHYEYVKSKIIKNQTENDLRIININDKTSMKIEKNALSKVLYISKNYNDKAISYLKDNTIYYKEEEIINTNDLILKGNHNYENIMQALTVAKEMGCKNDSITEVLKSFKGVEHRLELVDVKNGITFYNDTEATNTICTTIALASFDKPIILFLGGYERNQNFEELLPYSKNIKAIIALGQCKNRVIEFSKKYNIEVYDCEKLDIGFKKAIEIASNGDIILLSPASASWDQYEKCEDRGDEFKKYVEEL